MEENKMDEDRRKVLVGINGFGIIGRLVYRMLSHSSEIQVAAINDLAPRESLEYLLRHDTNHGQREDLSLKDVRVTQIPEVQDLNWGGIDIVVDSTPHLRTYDQLSQHLNSGARTVIRSSPLKGSKEKMQTIVLGVNGEQLEVEKYQIFGMASCTTNCLAPLVKVVMDYCQKTDNEVVDLDFVTVHAYTPDQTIKDMPHKSDLLRGRDVHNIIEAETGASSQIIVVFPQLAGKIFGTAYRVPVSDGSALEVRVETTKEINVVELNKYFAQAAQSQEMKGILSYKTEPLTSGDCLNDPHTCVYLEKAAAQISPRKVKLGALYDNEFGYSSKLVELIKILAERKFKPEMLAFKEYQNQAAISLSMSACEEGHDPDCDCHVDLNEEEIPSLLARVAEKKGWQKGFSLEDRHLITTPQGDYLLRPHPEENWLVMYDGQGRPLAEPKKHHYLQEALWEEIKETLMVRS